MLSKITHSIACWWRSKSLKNTMKRTRYRIYLWKRINGQEKPVIEYGYSTASLVRPDESFLVHHSTIFNIGLMFNSTPNGRFVSDENLSSIKLPKEDEHLGFKNPFEEQEKTELETLGRILTLEERKRKSLIKKMDAVEEKYYRDF